MGDLAYMEEDPPKVFIINLETDERWDALFNPTTLEESTRVNFKRHQVSGLSHERLQYINTGNKTVPLEFFLSQQAQDERFGTDITNILDDKAFLESLAYPSADMDFSYQGTPKALFVWPGTLRMVGRVIAVDFMNRDFKTRTGQTTILVASVEFEEDNEFKRLMDEVRQYGGQRFRDRVPGEDDDTAR